MTATLRKWATDLMVGGGIAVLGLVLLAGGGKALGVVPGDTAIQAKSCPIDPSTMLCATPIPPSCKTANGQNGTCTPSSNCPCKP